MGRRRRASTMLPCGHRPGECGECLRCGRCYTGFAEDHVCHDGRRGAGVHMPHDPVPLPPYESKLGLKRPPTPYAVVVER